MAAVTDQTQCVGEHDNGTTSAERDETICSSIGQQRFLLTNKCHHYTRRKDVGWDIQKYWEQRHSIFSRYDEGIYMTDDAWYGVTPEAIANQIARTLARLTSPKRKVLIDMFAGVAGNVIAFALSNHWSHIIAIEKDVSTLACAQQNASIYGIADRITWVNADSFEYLAVHACFIDPEQTVVFASPPWGGPGYTIDKIFDLGTMKPYSVNVIHEACKAMELALYLPRTSNLRQIAQLAPEGKKIEVVQYCMQGASKALVAYIPSAVSSVAKLQEP